MSVKTMSNMFFRNANGMTITKLILVNILARQIIAIVWENLKSLRS